MLAVAWTMEKFLYFLYASHFILKTDQKTLEATLSQSINQASPTLQRILIRTFIYHCTVQYIPGLTYLLADCLSQLGGQKDIIKLPKLHAYQITNQLCARSDSLQSELELLHKRIMSLHCSSIASHKVGQAQLKKFPVFFSLIGHLERSSF